MSLFEGYFAAITLKLTRFLVGSTTSIDDRYFALVRLSAANADINLSCELFRWCDSLQNKIKYELVARILSLLLSNYYLSNHTLVLAAVTVSGQDDICVT